MEIIASQEHGRVPVTVLSVRSEIDAFAANEIEARARGAIAAGARHLLIDLTDVPCLGRAGILAIDRILEFLLADRSRDEWRAMDEGIRAGTFKSPHLKLVNPSPLALQELRRAGTNMYLEIHHNLKDAVASFGLAHGESPQIETDSRVAFPRRRSRTDWQSRIAKPSGV